MNYLNNPHYDVGIAKNPHIFPEWLGTPVAQQMRSGNYLDWLANCPYEMHDLLADAVLSSLIYSLKEDTRRTFITLPFSCCNPRSLPS